MVIRSKNVYAYRMDERGSKENILSHDLESKRNDPRSHNKMNRNSIRKTGSKGKQKSSKHADRL